MLEHMDITTNPQKLADMIAINPQGGHGWNASELATIFKHQLASPLLVDLSEFDPTAADQSRMLALKAEPPIETFSDLLTHPNPPVELLDQVKGLSKAMMNRLDSVLPRELTVVLYYLAIACAIDRTGNRLTTLAEAELRQGLTWSAQQPWLDPIYKNTLQTALTKL